MHGMKLAGIELDRKVMADLAMNEPAAFRVIIAQVQAVLDVQAPVQTGPVAITVAA